MYHVEPEARCQVDRQARFHHLARIQHDEGLPSVLLMSLLAGLRVLGTYNLAGSCQGAGLLDEDFRIDFHTGDLFLLHITPRSRCQIYTAISMKILTMQCRAL